MQVDICSSQSGDVVSFACDLGEGVGRWRGEPGDASGTFSVELDVVPLVPWSSIEMVGIEEQDRFMRSAVEASLVDVIGRVKDYDSSGVLTLTIGSTSLLLDTSGCPKPGVAGQRVLITGLAFELYPYSL